ncbi:lasso peptide biosynthesis B2 protein [Aurantiacibacter rhizosphaerae]|uniref:Lasso peptide biosynthesis B2 protein n=1 Tax=Aurantiacibacter rhizosphaerae TaxID=2691582 RepID=A0A844X9E0_9SPHN|nr:lasso peptide biosynthesis B2 protein [Aurantiacibacter rhizosphaerae]
MKLFRTIHRLRSTGLGKLLRGSQELALARFRLYRVTPAEIGRLNTISANGRPATEGDQGEIAAELTCAIRLSARVVPWRSDCLVQALAAQRWCSALGIPTEISIQVGYAETREFMAHAILLYEGTCILGATDAVLSDIYPSRMS